MNRQALKPDNQLFTQTVDYKHRLRYEKAFYVGKFLLFCLAHRQAYFLWESVNNHSLF